LSQPIGRKISFRNKPFKTSSDSPENIKVKKFKTYSSCPDKKENKDFAYI
jgi:hypothetical protein